MSLSAKETIRAYEKAYRDLLAIRRLASADVADILETKKALEEAHKKLISLGPLTSAEIASVREGRKKLADVKAMIKSLLAPPKHSRIRVTRHILPASAQRSHRSDYTRTWGYEPRSWKNRWRR